MNRSRDFRLGRVLGWMAMLFGVMVTTLLPAYGQQEVNPTWYDPWGTPSAVHSSAPRVAMHRHQRTVRPLSAARVAGKVHGKRSTTRARQS
jgi:hypothetical protein